jgi:hypothetical protein
VGGRYVKQLEDEGNGALGNAPATDDEKLSFEFNFGTSHSERPLSKIFSFDAKYSKHIASPAQEKTPFFQKFYVSGDFFEKVHVNFLSLDR